MDDGKSDTGELHNAILRPSCCSAEILLSARIAPMSEDRTSTSPFLLLPKVTAPERSPSHTNARLRMGKSGYDEVTGIPRRIGEGREAHCGSLHYATLGFCFVSAHDLDTTDLDWQFLESRRM
jgi:hypothetical protein